MLYSLEGVDVFVIEGFSGLFSGLRNSWARPH